MPPLQVSITHVGSAASLRFESIPGKTYRTLYKNSLIDNEWQTITPDRNASEGILAIQDDTGNNSQRFYRIILLQ